MVIQGDTRDGIPPFLRLPPELRQSIWHIFYSASSQPWIRYQAISRNGIMSSRSVDLAPTYVCRLFRAEVWSAIWSMLRLHLSRRPELPFQHAILPPPTLAREVQSIVWHMSCYSDRDLGRLPRRPVKLQRFPKLRDLTICYAEEAHIELLPVGQQVKMKRAQTQAMAGGEEELRAGVASKRLDSPRIESGSLYLAMSSEDRVAQWLSHPQFSVERLIQFVTDNGRGGWLSRLVDPAQYPEPMELTPDSIDDREAVDDDDDEDKWRIHAPDFEHGSVLLDGETPADAEIRELAAFRAVAARVRVMVEVELYTMGGNPPFGFPTPIIAEPVLVLVDVGTKTVLEARQLSREEHKYRQDNGLSPCEAD